MLSFECYHFPDNKIAVAQMRLTSDTIYPAHICQKMMALERFTPRCLPYLKHKRAIAMPHVSQTQSKVKQIEPILYLGNS